MKRWISVLISFCLMCGVLPAGAAVSNMVNISAVNLEFEAEATNAVPSGVSLTNVFGYVRQPEEAVRNKVLEVTQTAKAGALDIPLDHAETGVVFSFDYKTEDTMAARSVNLTDGNSKTGRIFEMNAVGELIAGDGRKLADLKAGRWYTFAFVYRPGEKRGDLYLNGRCVAPQMLIGNAAEFGTARALTISTGNGGYGAKFYLDNLRVYAGDTLLNADAFPHEEYNPEAEPYADGNGKEPDTESVYIYMDFDEETAGKEPGGGTALPKEDGDKILVQNFPDEKNKSLELTKGGTADPLFDVSVGSFNALEAVLEVSFCSMDDASNKVITLRDVNAGFNEVLRVAEGGKILVSGKNIGSYEVGKWHTVSVVLDYRTMAADAYLDEQKAAEKIPFVNLNSDTPEKIRMTIPTSSAAGTVYWDDIHFYAGNAFKEKEELKEAANDNSGGQTLITPEEQVKKTLEGAVALQAYGTAAYKAGEKTKLETAAILRDGVFYAPLRFAAEALGGTVSWDEATRQAVVRLADRTASYGVDSTQVSMDGNTYEMEVPAYIEENTTMVPASEFSERLAEAEVITNEKYGLVVIDPKKKNLDEKQIKDIYDYITYTRPTAEQIRKDFEPMQNVHPRIMATAERFDEIANQIQTDAYMGEWYEKLIAESDATLKKEHTSYIIPDGLRLLEMSRQLLRRAYTLGMAYRLTQKSEYLDYLWGEVDAVCHFADWNAKRHFLDPAEMMTGVAIAYDWCYEYWSEEQRRLMEESMLNMGLKEGELFYEFKGTGTQWQTINNNWSFVCNGGMTVAALALMDLYPEYCASIIETAFRSLENALGEYAPDGGWVEGPSYWGYATQYLGYYMAALESALGTTYGYLDNNGLDATGYFMTCTQSYQGSFNVGDGGSYPGGDPTVFYFARYFQDPALARLRLQDMENYSLNGTAFDMLYFDPAVVADSLDLPLDYLCRDMEMTTFRSAWGDKSALFAAIKGGFNDSTHGNLDAGTFVLDALGERWAYELGSDNYNQGYYFTKENGMRYKLYFCSTQGQNVLALNPMSELGQEQFGFPKVVDFVSKPKGGYSIIDMSSAYGNKVSEARRGLKVDHDRTQVVVQDELNLKNKTDLWWFMQTKAAIELSPNAKQAVLTMNGKIMYVILESNVKKAKFSVSESKPLEGSGIKPGVNSTAAYRRLQIQIPDAKGDVRIAVRFIPISNNVMLEELKENGVERMIPIQNWKMGDGAIERPILKELSVNGKAIEDFAANKYTYTVNLEFGEEEVPQVSAVAEDGCKLEITQADSPNGTAAIKITNADGNVNYYSIYFKVQPYMGQPEGYQKFEIKDVTVSGEPQKENPRGGAIDGDLNTRWSAEGSKEWIQVDLGEVKNVDAVTLAFYSGTQRVTYFDIQFSADGKKWEKFFSGESSGLTDDYESYFVGGQKTRYIRLNCFGNSLNLWNSVSEIEVYGK